jgi:hypothetical protein
MRRSPISLATRIIEAPGLLTKLDYDGTSDPSFNGPIIEGREYHGGSEGPGMELMYEPSKNPNERRGVPRRSIASHRPPLKNVATSMA